MDVINPEDLQGFIALLVQVWQSSARVGPIVAIALGVVGMVWLARRQLSEWIPWLATRRGALVLVALFAAAGSAGMAALQGETSVLAIVVQAIAAALTAVGIRSSTKAAKTGGAAEMEAWTEDGEKVFVLKHQYVRMPKDAENPEKDRTPKLT